MSYEIFRSWNDWMKGRSRWKNSWGNILTVAIFNLQSYSPAICFDFSKVSELFPGDVNKTVNVYQMPILELSLTEYLK